MPASRQGFAACPEIPLQQQIAFQYYRLKVPVTRALVGRFPLFELFQDRL